MSTTILRTADAWWIDTPGGAARIDTDATTTGGLLGQPEKIEAARASKKTARVCLLWPNPETYWIKCWQPSVARVRATYT